MSREPVFDVGKLFEIRCLEMQDGSCPVGDFLDALTADQRRRLDVIFEFFGQRGKIYNPENFQELSNSIFELRSRECRVLCFTHGRLVFLAHAVVQKRGKVAPEEILTAEERRRFYITQQVGGYE